MMITESGGGSREAPLQRSAGDGFEKVCAYAAGAVVELLVIFFESFNGPPRRNKHVAATRMKSGW